MRQERAAVPDKAARLPARTPFIIPVKTDDSSLPTELRHIHAIDISVDGSAGLLALRKLVIELLTQSLEQPFAHVRSAMCPDQRSAWRRD